MSITVIITIKVKLGSICWEKGPGVLIAITIVIIVIVVVVVKVVILFKVIVRVIIPSFFIILIVS